MSGTFTPSCELHNMDTATNHIAALCSTEAEAGEAAFSQGGTSGMSCSKPPFWAASPKLAKVLANSVLTLEVQDIRHIPTLYFGREISWMEPDET